jgi:hypothetical protein
MLALSSDEIARMNAALEQLARANSTTLRMADRASHTLYTLVAGVREMRGPQITGAHADATTHVSAGWQESISALREGGKLVFEVAYTRANHASLADAALEQTLESFKLTFADGTGLQFNALVDIHFAMSVSGLARASFTLTVSGAVAVF